MNFKTAILTLTILATGSVGYACTSEVVINSDGTSSVKTVCDNGGVRFVPGGSGGSCKTVMIPGKGAVLLCE